ncbi:hypothetical protein ACIGEP_11695 [Microbacterium sp. NPDC077663]|uniref:hypothetical protein n=1 Tax=Microbacterium sp. NPDC077663 TaxID=3364189 RepID=UPI0037CB5187
MPARLSFTLPGEWLAIDPRDEAAAADRVDAAVRDIVGSADDAALTRRRLRERLTVVVGAARTAGAHGVFLCLEVAPGVRLPATLTVHAPSGMSLTPSIGTSADAVLGTLDRSLRAVCAAGADTATKVSASGGGALRLHRVVEDPDAADESVRRLEADYWYPVPGAKRVVLASFATPLGHLHDPMLHLFDSVAATASFASGV